MTRKTVLAACFFFFSAVLLYQPSAACAKTVEVSASAEYVYGPGETEKAASIRALNAARRAALPDAVRTMRGFLKDSGVKKPVLTDEQIGAWVMGYMDTAPLPAVKRTVAGGTALTVKVRMSLTDDDISERANKAGHDVFYMVFRMLNSASSRNAKAMERLKKEHTAATGGAERSRAASAMAANEMEIEAYARFESGFRHGLLKMFDAALIDYAEAVRLKPGEPEFYNWRGIAYGRKAEYDKAAADFMKAAELNPSNADYRYNLGLAYLGREEHEKAIRELSKAIEIRPNFFEAYNNRATAYTALKSFDKAVADYGKAIGIKPDFATAYNNRGNAYKGKGMTGRAVEDFKKACELGSRVGCENLRLMKPGN